MNKPEPRPTPDWITTAAEACAAEVLVGAGATTFAMIISQHAPSNAMTPEQVERARRLVKTMAATGSWIHGDCCKAVELLREVVGDVL